MERQTDRPRDRDRQSETERERDRDRDTVTETDRDRERERKKKRRRLVLGVGVRVLSTIATKVLLCIDHCLGPRGRDGRERQKSIVYSRAWLLIVG